MRVWVTRAQPLADRTAERLIALGHQPLVAPLLQVAPLKPALDLNGVGAVAFTSANGVDAFCALVPHRALPVYAVGVATAQAARAAGFPDVASADGDVAALAALAGRAPPRDGVVLLAGALEPAGDLIGALHSLGVKARAVAVYETRPLAAPPEALAALPHLDAVLIHSPRAGRVLAEQLAGRADLGALAAVCISVAAAQALAPLNLAAVRVAATPDEAAMLARLDA